MSHPWRTIRFPKRHDFCKRGHEMKGDNIILRQLKNGLKKRECLKCRQELVELRHLAKKDNKNPAQKRGQL